MDFTPANADNPGYPGAGRWIYNTYYYDTPVRTDQQNLQGRLSHVQTWQTNVQQDAVYSYDNMGRVSWINYSFPSMNKWIRISYWYDLQGNVVKKGMTDPDDLGNTLYTFYTYDAAGRLSTVKTGQNSDMTGTVQAASYQYFASGKPKQLTLGTSPATTITYKYNERDWLTNINAGKYWERIGYNNSNNDNNWGSVFSFSPQWNGNISWTAYSILGNPYPVGNTSATVGLSYAYDYANRLSKADFGYWAYVYKGPVLGYVWQWAATNAYDEKINNYDGNGNIIALQRYDNNGSLSDNLSYNYTQAGTNRLTSIGNAANGSTYNYTYDPNGNLASDSHGKITSVTYNSENLPLQVICNGTTTNYWYDSYGNRFRKQGGSTDELYILGKDGETEAVFETSGMLKFWNILAPQAGSPTGTESIGRIEKK